MRPAGYFSIIQLSNSRVISDCFVIDVLETAFTSMLVKMLVSDMEINNIVAIHL